MDSFFSRFRNSLVLLTLLVIQTVGLAIQVRRPAASSAATALSGPSSADSSASSPDGPHVTVARSWVVGVLSPAERAVHTTSNFVRSTWGNYFDLRHTRQQNLDLRHQIDTLRLQQAAIAEDALEGQRLQSMLAFQQHYVSGTVAAQIIGTSGTDLSRVLYLDKGAADGLRPDMAVITPDGIVGKIREVFPQAAPHTAQVLLVNDQTSGAGVILADTRLRAVIRGTASGQVQIGNLTPDSRIKPGERVLTSGGDQIFPRGLPVGTVESIAPDPDHPPYTAIRVRPAANLFQIEEVLVITGTESSLPRATLDALARGAALTAETRAAAQRAAAARAAAAAQAQEEENARNAAEIVADRLPSLHDSPGEKAADANAAKAAAADPRNAGGAVPRPVPTVHPDRYSPGTTPPAIDLRPGAPAAAAGKPSGPAGAADEAATDAAPAPSSAQSNGTARRKRSSPRTTEPPEHP